MINKLIGENHWKEFSYLLRDFTQVACSDIILKEDDMIEVSDWKGLTEWLLVDLGRFASAVEQGKFIKKDYQTIYKLYKFNQEFLIEQNELDGFKFIKEHLQHLIYGERVKVDNLENLLMMDNLNFLWKEYIKILIKKDQVCPT